MHVYLSYNQVKVNEKYTLQKTFYANNEIYQYTYALWADQRLRHLSEDGQQVVRQYDRGHISTTF